MEFASFLHNPGGYPTKEETAAMLVFKRKERFIWDYDAVSSLRELLVKYFGDMDELNKFGLVKQFKALKLLVEEHNLIGLILIGADINNVPDKIQYVNIQKYATNTGGLIDLKITPICQRLITDYIKKENIENLCRETPNFDIYYGNLHPSKN